MRLNIPRNIMINTAFIMLLAIFTSGFLWSFYLQKENNRSIDLFYRSTNWYANRMLYQSENFLYQVHLYRLGAAPLSDLTESYDLVWNRLQLFLESSTTEVLRKRHPSVTKDVETLFARIKSLEDDLNHPEVLHSAAFANKIAQVKDDLLNLNYSLSRVLTSSISEGTRQNNDLIQFWQLSVFIITVLLSIALLRLTRRSSKLATLDPLTQLGNRRALTHYVKQQLKRKKALSLCAIDLKRFKQINDQIGYQVGDQVLVEFANQLSLLKDCHAFRLGGDEFVLVGTYSGAQANLAHWVKELKSQLEFDYQSNDHQFPVLVRLGITYTDENNQPDAETLLDQAIHALNETKQGSNEDYAFYTDSVFRVDRSKSNVEKLQDWVQNPQSTCPLSIRLSPLCNPVTQQNDVVEFHLTWKDDNSLCAINWLAEQSILLLTLPLLLESACQLTSQPILIRLHNPYQLEQLIKTEIHQSLGRQVIFGLPNLAKISDSLLARIKEASIKIAVEQIGTDDLIEISNIVYVDYWIPGSLPNSPAKQKVLLELAQIFGQITLLPPKTMKKATTLASIELEMNPNG